MSQNQAAVLVTTTERPAGYEVKQALGQVFGVVVSGLPAHRLPSSS